MTWLEAIQRCCEFLVYGVGCWMVCVRCYDAAMCFLLLAIYMRLANSAAK